MTATGWLASHRPYDQRAEPPGRLADSRRRGLQRTPAASLLALLRRAPRLGPTEKLASGSPAGADAGGGAARPWAARTHHPLIPRPAKMSRWCRRRWLWRRAAAAYRQAPGHGEVNRERSAMEAGLAFQATASRGAGAAFV